MPVPSAQRQVRRRRDRARGQSLVEFALFVPVLLLIVLAAIDFGRVFVGWIGVNQMVRIAASYAATHPNDWPPPAPLRNPTGYDQIFDISHEHQLNCTLVRPIPVPVFGSPKEVGQ